jgi:phage protein D/phage baseplate assembly protein gpV
MLQYYAPDFAVKVAGLTLEADVSRAVIELSYESSLDQAEMFRIQLNNADLRLSDSGLFDVGKHVEIFMGYAGDLHPMIMGEITAVNPTFPQSGAPTLAITGYDRSHRMRHNNPDRFTFNYVNDSLIAAQIALENQLVPVVDPAPTTPRTSILQHGSDWALLSELAERNFFQVFVRWDKLYFRFPRPQTKLVTLEWGRNLSSFSPRLSTAGMAGLQVLRDYNYKLAETIVTVLPAAAVSGDLDDLVERLGSDAIEHLATLGRRVIRDQPVDNFIDAATVARALLRHLLEGLYEGSGSCIGIPSLRAGDMVEIAGVGRRFSGRYTLHKVTHTINSGGYQTRFDVSQKTNLSLLGSLRNKIAETPTPSRQEPQYGVVVGIVGNNLDPEGLGRVQLKLPHFSDTNLSEWARIAVPMAGDDRGIYFLPEIGDEVLVAFDQGNINRPVVVGSLWNGQARPPEQNSGLNARKVIRSRSGMQIVFDETPGSEQLTLTNSSGSSITLDDANGDIVIEAQGNVKIKSGAGGKVQLNPSS